MCMCPRDMCCPSGHVVSRLHLWRGDKRHCAVPRDGPYPSAVRSHGLTTHEHKCATEFSSEECRLSVLLRPRKRRSCRCLLQCSAVLINSSSGFKQNPTIYQRSMEKNLSVEKKKTKNILLLQGSVPMCSVDKKEVEVCV